MSNGISEEEKQEKKILRAPNVGEASDLYWTSRAGDVGAVRQILTTKSFNDLNRLEPNGSTALHAASFFGHADVVRLLLQERGVMRHRKNRHGLTAYEEAANDKIRQLFHRPNNNRFCEDSTGGVGEIFDLTADPSPDNDDDKLTDNWLQGFRKELEAKAYMSTISIARKMASSSILRSIVARLVGENTENPYSGANATKGLREIIDTSVTSAHPEYDKACELVSKYVKTKKLEHLLRLYTLQTPFYRELGSTGGDLTLLLYFRLSTLKARAFHGRSYRGLSMTKQDFKAYQWALKKKGSIIATQKLLFDFNRGKGRPKFYVNSV